MKTEKEIQELKEEYEHIEKQIAELSEDELAEITGGSKMLPLIFSVGLISQMDVVQSYMKVLLDNTKHE